jgi:ABC transport system ATP-binding/permease protein
LTGEQSPDSGIVEAGDTIKLGVYDQLGIKIENPDQSVLDFVLEQVQANDQFAATDASVDARRLLNRFEFPRQRWNQRISVLSGGERRRLQLLSVITKNPNFLILDECTSDLDHQTVMAVESYLQEFNGVLLIISHDRFFADKVSDHLFIFEGGGSVLDYPGTLSEYASTLIEQENESIMSQSPRESVVTVDGNIKKDVYKDDKAKRNEQRNNAKQLKRDMESLEKSIDKLKIKATSKQKEIDESSAAGWSVLAALTDELNTMNETIDEQEVQWMELAEQLEVTEVEV